MPNRDGTGPCGMGPKTGKGRGPCKTKKVLKKKPISKKKKAKKGRK